jgi:hypothetical protein
VISRASKRDCRHRFLRRENHVSACAVAAVARAAETGSNVLLESNLNL